MIAEYIILLCSIYIIYFTLFEISVNFEVIVI